MPSKVVATTGKVVQPLGVGEIAIFAPYLTYDVTPSCRPRVNMRMPTNHEGARDVCVRGWVGGHGTKAPTHEPEVNQCCSGAKWVPIEVLEEGYGHRFGL